MNINTKLNGYEVNGSLTDITGKNDNYTGDLTVSLNEETHVLYVSALKFDNQDIMINVSRATEKRPSKEIRRNVKPLIKQYLFDQLKEVS